MATLFIVEHQLRASEKMNFHPTLTPSPRPRIRALMKGLGRVDDVRAIDSSVENRKGTLLLARDELGQSYWFRFCDVRDLVEGIVCLLVAPGAVGETFNFSGSAPFDYEEVVPKLLQAIGLPSVEVSIPGPRFDVRRSAERARRLAGYSPQFGINEILAAMRDRQQGATG